MQIRNLSMYRNLVLGFALFIAMGIKPSLSQETEVPPLKFSTDEPEFTNQYLSLLELVEEGGIWLEAKERNCNLVVKNAMEEYIKFHDNIVMAKNIQNSSLLSFWSINFDNAQDYLVTLGSIASVKELFQLISRSEGFNKVLDYLGFTELSNQAYEGQNGASTFFQIDKNRYRLFQFGDRSSRIYEPLKEFNPNILYIDQNCEDIAMAYRNEAERFRLNLLIKYQPWLEAMLERLQINLEVYADTRNAVINLFKAELKTKNSRVFPKLFKSLLFEAGGNSYATWRGLDKAVQMEDVSAGCKEGWINFSGEEPMSIRSLNNQLVCTFHVGLSIDKSIKCHIHPSRLQGRSYCELTDRELEESGDIYSFLSN